MWPSPGDGFSFVGASGYSEGRLQDSMSGVYHATAEDSFLRKTRSKKRLSEEHAAVRKVGSLCSLEIKTGPQTVCTEGRDACGSVEQGIVLPRCLCLNESMIVGKTTEYGCEL